LTYKLGENGEVMGDIDHDPNENSSVMGIVMEILAMMVMGILTIMNILL